MVIMYKHITENLISARGSHDIQKIKEALLFIIQSLENILEGQLSHETFSDFVHDPDMLFSINKDVFSESHPDTTIVTTGLIDQSLEMAGLTKHKKFADELKDSLLDLHSSLSRDLVDIENKKRKLSDVLEDIRLAIE